MIHKFCYLHVNFNSHYLQLIRSRKISRMIGQFYKEVHICDILTQGLIGLIEYSYHQGIPSFSEAHLKRTLGLNVFIPEQFQNG
jgi:hypothetical protein